MEEGARKKHDEISRIVRQVEAALRKGLSEVPGTLDDIETESQTIGELVKEMIERERLQSKGRGHAGRFAKCDCGELARRRHDNVRRVTTQSGVRRIRRSYYYCDHCRHGFCPLDADLALVPGEFSVRVRGLSIRFAGYVPFEAASREMREVLGVHVSASSIRRMALGAGSRLQADFDLKAALLARDPSGFASDRRPRQLHASMDGCMVMVGRQWREVKTAVVYQRRQEGEIGCADYYSTLSNSTTFGPKMRALAYMNGADRCGNVGVVADGARWIWQETAKNLPGAKQILDFYHAMEYVWGFANARWGEKSQGAAAWAKEQETSLLDDRVLDVIASMKLWDPSSQEQKHVKRTTLEYMEEHKGRMLYKTLKSQGWHIGSGVMEAANSAVVQQRMKRAGMRWEEPGAEAILKLRNAVASSRKVDFNDLAKRAATSA